MPNSESVPPEKLFAAISKTAKQIRFASALALTRVAKNAQAAVKKSLERRFELRNRWTQSGIRIKPASIKESEPFAEVFSRDWYIAQHEEGARRRVPKKTKAFFIPTNTDADRILGIDLHKKKYSPEQILMQRIHGNRPFRTRLRKSKQEAIAVRLPNKEARRNPIKSVGTPSRRGRTQSHREPLGILYVLEDDPIKIKERDWLFDTVAKTYDETLQSEYNNALAQALKTAR